jgi:hypothetical protein
MERAFANHESDAVADESLRANSLPAKQKKGVRRMLQQALEQPAGTAVNQLPNITLQGDCEGGYSPTVIVAVAAPLGVTVLLLSVLLALLVMRQNRESKQRSLIGTVKAPEPLAETTLMGEACKQANPKP